MGMGAGILLHIIYKLQVPTYRWYNTYEVLCVAVTEKQNNYYNKKLFFDYRIEYK